MATKSDEETKAPDKGAEYKTVRVPAAAYDLLHKLLQRASRDGWDTFGVKRTDPPTLGALIEEGLKRLQKA